MKRLAVRVLGAIDRWFERQLWPLCALAIMAAPTAEAATHYISPSGSASWSSSTTPGVYASLAVANTNVAPGDSVVMLNGTYSGDINPTHAGTSGQRIVYCGQRFAPTAVVVSAINLGNAPNFGGDFTTVHYVTATGGVRAIIYSRPGTEFSLGGPDHVIFHKISTSETVEMNGTEGLAESLTVVKTSQGHALTSEPIILVNNPPDIRWKSYPTGNEFRYSTLTWTNNADADQTCMYFRASNRWNVHHNTFNVTDNGPAGRTRYFSQYYQCSYSKFNDNVVNYVFNSPTVASCGLMGSRDSSSFNEYLRNTITVSGTGHLQYGLTTSQAGSIPGSCRNHTIEGNYIKMSNLDASGQYTGAITFQNNLIGTKIRFNVIDCVSHAIAGLGRVDTCLVAHNTFISDDYPVVGLPMGNDATSAGSRVVSNIFYGRTPNSNGDLETPLRANVGVALDSAGAFFAPGGLASAAIARSTASGTSTRGAAGSGGGFGISGKAIWGSPRFTDSTYATLNASLRAESWARTATLHDGFAGALNSAADTCGLAPYPGRVTDLEAVYVPGDNWVSTHLTWPGNSQFSGTGDSAEVQIRFSTSPITSVALFEAAEGVGAQSGNTVAGLGRTPGVYDDGDNVQIFDASENYTGQTLYFAARFLRTSSGSWSCLSNQSIVTVTAGDTCLDAIRPGAFEAMAIDYNAATTNVDISATRNPGSDQYTGDPGANNVEVRYSASPITDANFDAAALLSNNGGDGFGGAGDPVNRPVGKLPIGIWYVGVKAFDFDQHGLWSCLATDSVAVPDYIWPAQPTNLLAEQTGTTTARITFTMTGDDSITNAGLSYQVYRSGAPITRANYAVANQLVSITPCPAPGTMITYDAVGLTPGGTYYFGARVLDDNGQFAISNSDSTVTLGPGSVPSTISSLDASSGANGSITCSWNAPGGDGSAGTAIEYDFRWSWRGPITSATWDDTVHTNTSAAQGGTYFLRYPVVEWPAPQVFGTAQSISFPAREGLGVWVAGKARGTAGWSAMSNVDSTTVRRAADLANFPRTFVYGVSGPRNPPFPAPTYYKGWPYLHFDGVTVNYTWLDKILNHPFVVLNQEAAVSDSFSAIARYRDAHFPATVFLFGVTTDPSFTFFGDSTSNTTAARWPRMMYSRVGDALRNVDGRGWPVQFAIPYSTGYNNKGLGYLAGADTLTPSPFLFCRGLGWKSTLFGSITGTNTANAGVTFSGINYAYRDVNGRFLVADTMAKIVKEVGYDRMYTKIDGSTARLYGGAQFDLSAADLLTPKVFASIGDYPDWRRAGVAPFNYPDSVSFLAGWVDGKERFYRRLRELTPAWGFIGVNGGTQTSHDYIGGSMREGWPGQQGGSWQTNTFWKPGGGWFDNIRFSHHPQGNTLFMFPTQETVSDSSMQVNFDPNAQFARANYRFALGSACLIGSYLNYGPAAAATMNGWGTNALAYPAWDFDERFVDAATGQAYPGTRYDLRGWGMGPTTDMYAQLPGATNRLFYEDFENGANPDSQAWNQGAGANGYTHVVPDPDGSGFVMRVRPAKLFGPNFDYFFSSISLGKVLTTSTDDYTISGEIQADSARWVSILLLKDNGTPWPANSFANTRVFAMPTKLPFSIRMPSPSSADSVRVAIFAGDTLGSFLIDNIQVHKGDLTFYRRDFQNMSVFVNPGASEKSWDVGYNVRRLTARSGVSQDVNDGSVASTVTVPGGDAVFVVPASGDFIRPGPINDFGFFGGGAASCNAFTASWSSVGDDSLEGIAASWEVRQRLVGAGQLTAANWASSAIVTTNEVISADSPAPAGQTQVAICSGFAAGTAYYVAVRVSDEAGNLSAVSNNLQVTTPACAVVADLPTFRRPRTHIHRR